MGGRKQQLHEEDAKERLAQIILTNTSLYVLLWVLGLKDLPLIRAGMSSVVGLQHIFCSVLKSQARRKRSFLRHPNRVFHACSERTAAVAALRSTDSFGFCLNPGSSTLQKAPQTLVMNHEISLGCSRS